MLTKKSSAKRSMLKLLLQNQCFFYRIKKAETFVPALHFLSALPWHIFHHFGHLRGVAKLLHHLFHIVELFD